jgi:hypothetical protein
VIVAPLENASAQRRANKIVTAIKRKGGSHDGRSYDCIALGLFALAIAYTHAIEKS